MGELKQDIPEPPLPIPPAPEPERDETDLGGPRIRCPKCGYRPRASDLWSCTCGHSWNTFDTAGLCPRCNKQWHDTACPSCHRWSPHADWYEPDQPPR